MLSLRRLANLFILPLRGELPLAEPVAVGPGLSLRAPVPAARLAPLLAKAGELLSPWEHSRIFGSAETLLPLHETLLAELTMEVARGGLPQLPAEACASRGRRAGSTGSMGFASSAGAGGEAVSADPSHVNEDNACVGALFCRLAPFLRAHAAYTRGHAVAGAELRARLAAGDAAADESEAVRLWTWLAQGAIPPLPPPPSTLGAYVRLMELDGAAAGQTLASLLAMPVQRVPRYALLLAELARHTPTTHGDAGPTREALRLTADAAGALNAAVAAHEEQMLLLRMERRLVPPPSPSLVAPHRRLVREGVLGKVSRPFRVAARTLLLCNDLAVIADVPEAVGGALAVHSIVTLVGAAELAWRTSDGEACKAASAARAQLAHAFTLLGVSRSYVLVAKDAADKAAWLAAIADCVRAEDARRASKGRRALAPSDAAPTLAIIPGLAPPNCEACDGVFGVFHLRARHLCGRCGKHVCGSCSRAGVTAAAVSSTSGAEAANAIRAGACDGDTTAASDNNARASQGVRVATTSDFLSPRTGMSSSQPSFRLCNDCFASPVPSRPPEASAGSVGTYASMSARDDDGGGSGGDHDLLSVFFSGPCSTPTLTPPPLPPPPLTSAAPAAPVTPSSPSRQNSPQREELLSPFSAMPALLLELYPQPPPLQSLPTASHLQPQPQQRPPLPWVRPPEAAPEQAQELLPAPATSAAADTGCSTVSEEDRRCLAEAAAAAVAAFSAAERRCAGLATQRATSKCLSAADRGDIFADLVSRARGAS